MSKFKHSLSVIVPVYNEEKILNDTIENLYYSLQKFSSDFEILIIENTHINKNRVARSERMLLEIISALTSAMNPIPAVSSSLQETKWMKGAYITVSK